MKIILVDAVHTFLTKDKIIFQPLYELLEQYQNRKILLTNADDIRNTFIWDSRNFHMNYLVSNIILKKIIKIITNSC